jgi:hypothetical protein
MTGPAAGTVAPTRREQLALLIEHADELEFVQNRRSGVVHIVVPTLPAWMREDGPRLADLPERELIESLMSLLLGKTPTLCGWTAKVDRNDAIDTAVSVSRFDDELLCVSCHRALGDHSARAFEHPRPGDEEE